MSKTVETSIYDSELVAARIAAELIIEIYFMLRSLDVELEGPTLMIGDNMFVVLNTSVPSSVLKKKHSAMGHTVASDLLRWERQQGLSIPNS
jgi:hypothetical protein